MASSQAGYTSMCDLKWSQQEKTIARQAFDRALNREVEVIIGKTKKMAKKIGQMSDLWKLETYLTRARKNIDNKYDYRYSVLLLVFANLIRDGYLSEEELSGLGEDKLSYIRAYVAL
jgi:hypothetical protein